MRGLRWHSSGSVMRWPNWATRAGARQASQQASALAGPVSDREKARIRLRALQFGDGHEPAERRSNYLQEFDLILAKYPHDVELLLLRGQADQQVPGQQTSAMPGMGVGEASLTFYQRALDEQPHYFAVHHYLTHAYENLGRMDLALQHAEEYLSLAPAVPHAHHMHGHILLRLNRTPEAIAEFRRADELELAYFRTENIAPEYDWQYHHNLDLLGVAYQYAGEMRQADTVLRRSFELPSIEFSQELNESAWPMLLLLEGRTDQAQSAAKDLMGRADPVVQALGHLMASRIVMRLGHADDAIEQGDRALHLLREAPNGGGGVLLPELELVQGEFLLRKGQSEKGRAMLRDGVSKLRADPAADRWTQNLLRIEAVETLARDLGDWALAGDVANQMRQFAPSYAGTHYALAKEAEHAGNADGGAPGIPGRHQRLECGGCRLRSADRCPASTGSARQFPLNTKSVERNNEMNGTPHSWLPKNTVLQFFLDPEIWNQTCFELRKEHYDGKTYNIKEECRTKNGVWAARATQVPDARCQSCPKRKGSRLSNGAPRQAERSRQEENRR